MIPFAVGFFGWPVYIACCIVLNYFKIDKQGKKPVYFASNQWRVFFGLVFLVLMSSEDGMNGIDLAYPRTLLPYWPHAVYILSSFYLFFDPGLSGLRGLRWNYRGKSSGWLDRLKIGWYYAIKITSLAGLIVSTIMIW